LAFLFFGLILGMGRFLPFYELAWAYLPGVKYFRVPARFVLLPVFSLSIFAAAGFHILLVNLSKLRISKKVLVARGFIALFVVITVIDLFLFASRYNTFIDLDRWREKPVSVQYFEQFEQNDTSFRVFSLGSEYSWPYLGQQAGGWVNDSKLFIYHREILEPNFNAIWKIPSSGSLVSQELKKHWRLNFFQRTLGLSFSRQEVEFPRDFLLVSQGFVNLLEMQSVKYMLTFFKVSGEGIELVEKIRFPGNMLPLNIYKLANPAPLAYLPNQVELVTTDDSLPSDFKYISRIYSDEFMPGRKALIEGEEIQGATTAPSDGVAVIKWQASEKEFFVRADTPTWLVINNTFYPGWQAFVDGEPVSIKRANYLFQAVFLAPGEHQVKLKFVPKSFYLGLTISLAALGLWLMIILRLLYQDRKDAKKK